MGCIDAQSRHWSWAYPQGLQGGQPRQPCPQARGETPLSAACLWQQVGPLLGTGSTPSQLQAHIASEEKAVRHCCCVQVQQQPPCHSDRGAMRSSLEERMSHPVCSSLRTVSCWVPLTGSAGHKSTWSFLPLSDTFLYARLTSVQVCRNEGQSLSGVWTPLLHSHPSGYQVRALLEEASPWTQILLFKGK